MKAFYSLLAVPAFFASSLAAPLTPRHEIIAALEGLLSDVCSATSGIKSSLGSGLGSDAICSAVETKIETIVSSIEGVIASKGLSDNTTVTMSPIDSSLEGSVGPVLCDLFENIQGSIDSMTSSGLDLDSLTGSMSSMVCKCTELVNCLQNAGLPGLMGVISAKSGSLPIVGSISTLLNAVIAEKISLINGVLGAGSSSSGSSSGVTSLVSSVVSELLGHFFHTSS